MSKVTVRVSFMKRNPNKNVKVAIVERKKLCLYDFKSRNQLQN